MGDLHAWVDGRTTCGRTSLASLSDTSAKRGTLVADPDVHIVGVSTNGRADRASGALVRGTAGRHFDVVPVTERVSVGSEGAYGEQRHHGNNALTTLRGWGRVAPPP